jgi:peptidylprolyl isomerase
MKTIVNGSNAKFHYTGKLEDGTVFDSTLLTNSEPIVATVGNGMLIPGFENALLGMSVGDSKTVTLTPTEGYGERNDNNIIETQLSNLPEGVEVGGTVLGVMADGNEHQFLISEINDGLAKLDGNHPLSGKNLVFEIELVDIVE